jgi:hypothetical protein
MFKKEYTKPDGTKVTECYESWWETTLTQGYVGIVYVVVGLGAIVSLPFVAVYKMFRPGMISYGEHKECLSWEQEESQG